MSDCSSAALAPSSTIDERFRYYQTRCNVCGSVRPAAAYVYFFLYEGHEFRCCTRCKDYAPGSIIRHEYWDRTYAEPDADAPLWRYVDLAKFVDLILFKRLWLSQVASLDDAFEGALGAKTRHDDWREWMHSFLMNSVKHPPEGHATEISEGHAQEEANRLLRDVEASLSRQRADTYVNCWHMAPHESFLMWKVYARDRPDSVCIKTNLAKIRKCLGPKFHIGIVNYIDFKSKFPDVNWPFLYKRAAFLQENEARIFASCRDKGRGFHVEIDPRSFIEEVLISPEAPSWVIENITRLVEMSELSITCRISDLSEEPF
jgi:hypothetical protein